MDKRGTSIAKGIAIVLMLFHHAFYSSKDIAARVGEQVVISYAPFAAKTVFYLARACKVCVPIFVFITGYGTYLSLRRMQEKRESQGIGSYATAHHVRLLLQFLPVFVLGVGASLLIVARTLGGVYGGKGRIAGLFYLFIDAMGLAKAFGTPTFIDTWWYLSLAILFLYLTPALVAFAERLDSCLLLAIVCLAPPLAKLDMSTELFRYLPALVLGIVCAQHHVLDEPNAKGSPWFVTLAKMVVLTLGIGVALYAKIKLGHAWLFHTMAAFFVCKLAMQIERFGGVVLAFLGKHSSNMFMCHTFFLSILLPKQIYGLGHWMLIVAGIVSVSLLTSMVLEFLKERLGYNEWCKGMVAWTREHTAMC